MSTPAKLLLVASIVACYGCPAPPCDFVERCDGGTREICLEDEAYVMQAVRCPAPNSCLQLSEHYTACGIPTDNCFDLRDPVSLVFDAGCLNNALIFGCDSAGSTSSLHAQACPEGTTCTKRGSNACCERDAECEFP